MKNYKILIAYDGTRYRGWQKQGNTGNTIQQKLEFILEKLDGEAVEVFGSGRTDAGTHAKGQAANFHLRRDIEPNSLLAYLNRELPMDIGVQSVEIVEERFHSRLSVSSKMYEYRIWNSPVHPVFDRQYLFFSPAPLALQDMQKGAAYLLGAHDFKSFCANKRYKKSTVRTLYRLDITQKGNEISMLFHGNGFLYQMVRILAGTLIEIGEGQRKPEDIPILLEKKERALAGFTAPAQGLTLLRVFYGDEKKRM